MNPLAKSANPPAPNPSAHNPVVIPPAPSPTAAAPGAPIVRDWAVKTFTCTGNETSFADVSRVLYGDEKYGKALLLYNRSYPLAGDHVRQDPPRLQPNAKVVYPPLEVLQANFPGAINDAGPRVTGGAPAPAPGAAPGPAPSPGPSPSPAVSPIRLSVPTPLVSGPGNPNVASLPPPGAQNFATADNVKLYRVREGGEHILQIAQTTLGDRARWPEINRLNPSLDPRYPIPGGIEIRVPGGR
jgi:hypothetical protein